MDLLHRLDDRLLRDANALARHTPWLHDLVVGYATYGVVLFAALLLAGLWWARHRLSPTLAAAGWACLATLLAVALNQPLVNGFREARPYTTHHHLLVLAQRSSDFSFPSDHATMAGAAAAALLLVSRRLGLVAAAAAALMAFARVYIAAHYPWDVVVGLAFGALVALVGWLLLRRPLTWVTERLRGLPGLRSVFTPEPPTGANGAATVDRSTVASRVTPPGHR